MASLPPTLVATFRSPEKFPQAADVRKAIAGHKDAWKVVDLLKQSVNHPDREPHLANPHTIVQSSYVNLLNLLTTSPARAPSAPYLDTLCHLLGEIPDPSCWVEARELVTGLFRKGSLSEEVFLEHAYPGFLRAFVVQVARCGYATSSPPGQITPDPQSEKLLSPMLAFLAAAFSRILADVSKEQGTPPDPELLTAGPTLTQKSLLRLAELITSTRAAEALAALSGSPFYPRSNMLCSAAAQAVSKVERAYRTMLDQMVPAIALKIYEDSDAAPARRIERAILIRHITRVLRPDD